MKRINWICVALLFALSSQAQVVNPGGGDGSGSASDGTSPFVIAVTDTNDAALLQLQHTRDGDGSTEIFEIKLQDTADDWAGGAQFNVTDSNGVKRSVMKLNADGTIHHLFETTGQTATGPSGLPTLSQVQGLIAAPSSNTAIYGSGYVTGGTNTLALTPADTYVQAAGLTIGETSGITVTESNAVVTTTGTYELYQFISFSGGNSKTIVSTIFVDGVAQSEGSFKRKLGVNGDVGSASAGAVLDLTAGEVLDIRLKCVGSTDTITIEEAQFLIARVTSVAEGAQLYAYTGPREDLGTTNALTWLPTKFSGKWSPTASSTFAMSTATSYPRATYSLWLYSTNTITFGGNIELQNTITATGTNLWVIGPADTTTNWVAVGRAF